MTDSVPQAATGALAELLEVSPQVDAAVILERDGGSVVASAPDAPSGMATRLAATCVRILDAAEQARRELGREPVSQVEVGTPDGHVFAVGDASWIVAAVTDSDPTVGLVFYDLKTALRAVRDAAASTGSPASGNGVAPTVVVTSTGDDSESDAASDEADDPGATDPAADVESGSGRRSGQRWRRRNR
jgi:predicted regulator of Ras-like GTPase activity (Roadblock/LC7/MglB family)